MRKFFGITAAMIALALPAMAQQIGVVASLQPAIDGIPPGQDARALAVGVDVVANERLVSSPSGRGQLLFRDQTTLTMAPDSELVLDKFVYDPAQANGEIALTLGKGALRFIGGQITKQNDGIIRTPNATIGVRGGILLVDLLQSGARVILLAGEYVCLDGGTGRHCASRPGAVLTAEGYQGVADPEMLTRLLRKLDGEDDPDPTQVRFSASNAGDVGPFDKGSLSTTGEENDQVIFESDIREDLFDDRQIFSDLPHDEMDLDPEGPNSPGLDPTSPSEPPPTTPLFPTSPNMPTTPQFPPTGAEGPLTGGEIPTTGADIPSTPTSPSPNEPL